MATPWFRAHRRDPDPLDRQLRPGHQPVGQRLPRWRVGLPPRRRFLCCAPPAQGSQTFNGGGIGGRIERFNWEGDLVWSYELATDTAHHHHDMAFLPNGNVVLMAWEYKSPEEAAASGRTSEGPLWPPMLVEIEPEGSQGGAVVWEWHAWDHLVQSSDSSLPHYGLPQENVTRFNVNYGNVSGGGFPGGNAGGDWFHCNGLDLRPTRVTT